MEKLLLIISALCLIICLFLGAYSAIYEKPMLEADTEQTDTAAFDSHGTEPPQATVTYTEKDTEKETVSDVIIETEVAEPPADYAETERESIPAIETFDSESTPESESVEESEAPEPVETEQYETETETELITEIESELITEIESELVTEIDTEPMADEPQSPEIPLSVTVPILMYHALTENAEEAGDTVITVTAFEAQIAALTEAGYTTLFFDDLRDYVNEGKPLPEKPILITFDDGYTSNLTLAAPLLAKYGQRATVSVIGVSVGKDTYKDTGVAMYPHFSLEEARLAYESGVLDFQSHTYDMHQNSLDTDPRKGMLPKENESEDEYIAALRSDFSASKAQIEQGVGNEVFVIVYPHGKSNPLLDSVLYDIGAVISVTVEEGINVIKYGQEHTLRSLRRINMDDSISGEALIEMLDEYLSQH